MVDTVHPGSRDQDTEADRLAQESAAAFRVAEATPDVGDKAAALREARKLAGDSALAAACTYLQRVVGIIAVSLPAVVAIGNMLFDGSG